MESFDWNDLRHFIELVRTENHGAAARRLKADHTTVRRRIAALETALQTRLFCSREQPIILTEEGQRMFQFAEKIEALAMEASERVMRTDVQVSGTVRIGAPDGFGSWFLTPRLNTLLTAHPALKIELVAIPRVFNLSKREADIAIALAPPAQNRQIVHKLTEARLGLYASPAYLATHPPLRSIEDISQHTLITYIPDILYAPELDYATYLDVPVGCTFKTASLIGQFQAARAGIGLAILPHYLTAGASGLQRVLEREFRLEREFWLIAHRDLVKLARVRTVIDFIIAQVTAERDLFIGIGLTSRSDQSISPVNNLQSALTSATR